MQRLPEKNFRSIIKGAASTQEGKGGKTVIDRVSKAAVSAEINKTHLWRCQRLGEAPSLVCISADKYADSGR